MWEIPPNIRAVSFSGPVELLRSKQGRIDYTCGLSPSLVHIPVVTLQAWPCGVLLIPPERDWGANNAGGQHRPELG